MKTLLAATVALFMLAGCADNGLNSQVATDAVVKGDEAATEKVNEITKADLEAALASAEAYNDAMGAACWRGLLAWQERNPVYFTKVIGAATLYQKTRNARRLFTEGAPDEIKIACSPMLMDSQSFIRRLAAMAGAPIPGL